jgi:iron(III) transport system substrate-binding protein
MQNLRRALVRGSVALAALAAPAAGVAASTGSITLYSGQHEQTVSKLVSDFEKRTGIHVDVRSSDEGELANQLLQEGSASPADVYFAENPPALEALRRRGLLATVRSSTLRQVPARYSSPQRSWLGVSARSVALAYDTKQVRPGSLPRSVLDLTKPAWRGKIGFAPTETDFQPVVTAIAKLRGSAVAKTWLEGLKSDGKVYPDNEALIAAVDRGDVALGLIDHYYWYRARDEAGSGGVDSKLYYFAGGDPGALVDVSGAAVLRSSKKQDLAQRFLAYLVSPAGQRVIATSESYEYPLRAGVRNPRLQRTLASLHPPDLAMTDLGDGRATLALLQQVGLL